MTNTVYTFHLAENHEIIGTATPSTLPVIAIKTARSMKSSDDDKTRRIYIHNGLGVVAAGLCRQGIWHEILRDEYREHDAIAREKRTAQGWPNDEKTPDQKQTEQILTVRDAREYLLGQWTTAARYTADELDAMNNGDLINLARMTRDKNRAQ